MREKAEPSGIGGWLILIAIGQILGGLRLLASLAQYYRSIDSQLWRDYPFALSVEAVLNLLLLAIMVVTTVFFFTKSHQFPTFFIMQYVASILLYPLDLGVVALAINAQTGQPISFILEQMINPKEVGQWLALPISAAIWIPYILRSKRVANTFPPREIRPGESRNEWSDADREKFKRLMEESNRQAPPR